MIGSPRRVDGVLGGLLRQAFEARGSDVRLAPERELSAQLGTSRATLGRGLAVLDRWGVVEPHRGSGVRVCEPASWSLGALPALLALEGLGATPQRELRALASDALGLRRDLARQLPARVGLDLGPGALDDARRAADAAWAVRAEPGEFVRQDGRVAVAAFEAGGARASAWTWNDLTAVAVALAHRGTEGLAANDYLEQQERLLGALERGDGRSAARTLATHLGRLDRLLLRALPTAAGDAS